MTTAAAVAAIAFSCLCRIRLPVRSRFFLALGYILCKVNAQAVSLATSTIVQVQCID